MIDALLVKAYTSGCCSQLRCVPVTTSFLCPLCESTWEDGETGDSEAQEMVGQFPLPFFQEHLRRGTKPLFSCDQCGQLFELVDVEAVQAPDQDDPDPTTLRYDHALMAVTPRPDIFDDRGLEEIREDGEDAEGNPTYDLVGYEGYIHTHDITGLVTIQRRFRLNAFKDHPEFTGLTVLGPGVFERVDELREQRKFWSYQVDSPEATLTEEDTP